MYRGLEGHGFSRAARDCKGAALAAEVLRAKRTSGAKARSFSPFPGTAEAVPFRYMWIGPSFVVCESLKRRPTGCARPRPHARGRPETFPGRSHKRPTPQAQAKPESRTATTTFPSQKLPRPQAPPGTPRGEDCPIFAANRPVCPDEICVACYPARYPFRSPGDAPSGHCRRAYTASAFILEDGPGRARLSS